MNTALPYQIAITKIPKVGPKIAKTLIAYCGGVEAVFRESKRNLLKIPHIGHAIAQSITQSDPDALAAKDIEYIEKHNIQTAFFINDERYPHRLKHYDGMPLLLYYTGNASLNPIRSVGIVGTRQPTTYGKEITIQFVEQLQALDVQIISGLAYGIDALAHQHSLQRDMETLAIMGTGIHTVYPAVHRKLAQRIKSHGAVVSQFPIGTKADRENFPQRNKIIAALSDAVIVIQSARKGGSLITAEFANTYNKDVFAVPGRIGDERNTGCNHLIKSNKAHLIESIDDLIYIMRWDVQKQVQGKQLPLFVELNSAEKSIAEFLKGKEAQRMDQIHYATQMPLSAIANHLLNLEFKGLVVAQPGNKFKLL